MQIVKPDLSTRQPRKAGTSIAGVLRGLPTFARDDRGAMSYLGIMMSVAMLGVGGIGIDLMMTEMKRTKLQATLDRAVLAAANLSQEMSPAAVVNDYVGKAGMASYVGVPTVTQGLNFTEVMASGTIVQPSNFLQLLGVDTLTATALAAAEERIMNVEISMVLDISGSMRDNAKMQNLKNAAKEFVDTVVNEDTHDLVSVSLVPYSEHVNVGPLIFDELNVNQVHSYSHCIEVPDNQFDDAALNTNFQFEQMQHFQWNFSGSNDRSDTVCPRYDYERIRPFSQNANQLKSQIDQFSPRAGTSIFLGMKWGTALLDPSTRSMVTNWIGDNEVDTELAGRPVAYSDPETLKTVILMTDGMNDRSHRIQDWAYNAPNEYAHWSRYNLNFYLQNYVSWNQRGLFFEQKYTAAQGDGLLDDICDAAKAQGIVVWSIGFEVTNHGADVMEDCASSPSHFFRVEGIEISEAFQSVARTINQLRLTQ